MMIPRLAAACCLVGLGGAASPLTPTAKWPLPTTYGVFNHSDHLILDASTGRIFASAKNIDVVFVINSTTGAVLHALSVPTPQGQGITRASAGGQRLLWVGSESDGVLRSFDADTFAGPVHTVDFSSDADDILIDDVTGDVLVAAGDDPAVLATVSASTGVVLSSISVPAHIEGFDFVRGTDLVVANIPDAGSIVVVLDRKNHSIATTITLPSEFKDQVPMAYNSRNQHLMLGVHDPPSLLVLDLARSGAQVFSAPAPVDLDDMWLDESAELLFLSGGGAALNGSIAVFSTPHSHGETYAFLGETPAGSAGKNSMLDARLRKLYTTVPAVDGADAFIQVYSY